MKDLKIKLIILVMGILSFYNNSFCMLDELNKAITNKDLNKVKSLVSSSNVNHLDYDYNSPLHVACCSFTRCITVEEKSEMCKIVKELIKNGANIEARNKCSCTSLHMAATYNCNDIVKILIDNGANIHATDMVGYTSLLYIASCGDPEIVHLLIKKGAAINVKSYSGKTTALHRATDYIKKDIVKLLIVNGADVNAQGRDNETPLHIIAKKYKSSQCSSNSWIKDAISIARMLLENKANKNIVNDENKLAQELTDAPEMKDLISKFDYKEYINNRTLKDLIIEYIHKNRDKFPTKEDLSKTLPQDLFESLAINY